MSPRERTLVPEARFRSYYGRPILKEPAWRVPDVPLYLFLGGTAGMSATSAGVARLAGLPRLATGGEYVAAAASLVSVGALIHDLGRPSRFLNMMRVFKPTSPLSVGTYILGPFSALSALAAASRATGVAPRVGSLASGAAAALGPAMATYTSVLLADTAIPAWHDAYPQLPFLFGGSALASAAGAALLATPAAERGPARRMAAIGAALELAAGRRMESAGGLSAEPYGLGRAGTLMRAGRALTAAGGGLGLLGRRRGVAPLAGALLVAGGLCTRFGVFEAGVISARDPKYVVVPQRARLAAKARAEAGSVGDRAR